uniref:Uncharacterized protein n=1 Tax=Anopheles christyi TaxID=43041 RepID=A0A182JQL3_9DIPT
MKPVVLSCFCLVVLLATTSFAAPTSRKGTESSSESVESNESNSKETTGEVNNAAEVTEDTNTAQEVTLPENNVKDTVKLEPTKTVEQTVTDSKNTELVPESSKAEVKLESTKTAVESVETNNVVGQEDSLKTVAAGDEITPEDSAKKVSVTEDSKVEMDATRTLETVEQPRETVQVTDVTQKVNDLPTVEVTVTLAEKEGIDLRGETNDTVLATTETDTDVATDAVVADV